MFESLKETLAKWNAGTDARVKLQHVYMTVAVGLVFLAGLVGLINHAMGQNILVVAIISAGVFLANAVVWALLQSAVLARIPRRTSGKNSKSK
jgi:hypothetical protein